MKTNYYCHNRPSFLSLAVIVGTASVSLLSTPAFASGIGSFIGNAVSQAEQEIGKQAATNFENNVGNKSTSIDGKITKSVANSRDFKLIQSWLDNNLQRHPNGQVRIVVTPKQWACNHIQYSPTTLGEEGFAWQCSSANNISIYFSKESGIGEWIDWVKAPKDLHNKLIGPELKADGGVGDGKTDSYQMAFSTGLTMMASNPIDYETTSVRAGPKLPENHNWLPNNILNKKSGFTGNSNGYLSIARLFGSACNDVESSLSLQNHPQTLCWIN